MYAIIIIFLFLNLIDRHNLDVPHLFAKFFISYVLFTIFIVIYMHTGYSMMGPYLFL